MQNPIFYLSNAGEVRKDLIFIVRFEGKRYVAPNKLFGNISPSLIGQKYGLGGDDITRVVLSPKYAETGLFPINDWPCYVYISIPTSSDIIAVQDLRLIETGICYETLEEMEAYIHRFSDIDQKK